MDFHSLTRRELQALCKQNGIPANITNIGMADALTALHSTVQKIEEISDGSKSVSVRSSVESPEKVEVTSPRVPRTRTTRKKVESSTVVNKATTTTRRITRNKKDGVAPANIDVQFSEVDNQSEIRKGKEPSIPQTPSMVSDNRKRSSKAEITTTKAYSTRRSTRLAVKTLGHTDTSLENKEDAANMKLFSADCGDNFEMNDNECADLTDVQSTVSYLKEDASETITCEEIMSNYSADDIPIDLARESPKDSNKSAEKVKIDEVNGILGNTGFSGDDINEEANIESMDEIIGENGNDTNEQAVVEMKDEVAGNNDDGNLVSKMMDMSLTNMDGVITQVEDHAVSDEIVVDEFVPMSEEEEHVIVKVAAVEQVDKIDLDEPSQDYSKEDELLPKSEVGDLVDGDQLAEAENHALSDAIVVDEFVPMSEEEEHVSVKVADVEQVDKIDCDEASQQYSKEGELLPKSEVEDLVNGGVLAETETHAASDAIVVDEFVPMAEVEDHVLVKAAVGELSDKIDCDVPSQEYSKEDELVNGEGEGEFLFDWMPSDKEKVEDVVTGESGKPSQKSSKDDKFSPKSFSVEESSEEEGSEDESQEGSEDESQEESEEEDLVYDAVGGLLVNRDSDKPNEMISQEEVEDLVKVAAGAQLDKKPSEIFEDANIKASIFVDDSEGILPLSAMTAPPAPGKKNPNAAGKENLEKLSMRQIRKMIKGLNINADNKNDKDNLVKKSDEELVVEAASRRPALQMLPENQN